MRLSRLKATQIVSILPRGSKSKEKDTKFLSIEIVSLCQTMTTLGMELSVWWFLGLWLFMQLLVSWHSFQIECWNKQYRCLGTSPNVWYGVVLWYADLLFFLSLWYLFNERWCQEQLENSFSNFFLKQLQIQHRWN